MRDPVSALITRVRARWRTLALLEAGVRAALATLIAVLVAAAVIRWTHGATFVLAGAAAAMVLAASGAAAWIVWTGVSRRRVPSDLRIARLIEERVPWLEDRLATAVDVMTSGRRDAPATLAAPMLAAAAAAARSIDPGAIMPSAALRRAGIRAAAAGAALLVALALNRGAVRQAWGAAWLVLAPNRAVLQVFPGDARVTAGSALPIEARLVGVEAPVLPRVEIGGTGRSEGGPGERAREMAATGDGRFQLRLDSVAAPFTYHVVAGPLRSREFAIDVVYPPRVARIDVDYTYPPALGLKPRTEVDAGDIYAPAGTGVRLRIQADRPAASGSMALSDGRSVLLALAGPGPLAPASSGPTSTTLVSTTLTIVEDDSYRLTLADREGRSSAGETEYFIRVLEDRPPQVHITKPASDRPVTPLDEIDVEAQANDDYGIERLELVYSVRGGRERVLPFAIPSRQASVTGRRTLYLEDLEVQPGDIVSYYARARDITRGPRANEARSDMFFLEVKPFEQEFAMAQSQSMAGSGYSGSIDDLVNLQKQVVVATWKLDRRKDGRGPVLLRDGRGPALVKGQPRGGAADQAGLAQDIRSISRTEAELRARVEQTSSSFRETAMRDPRRPNGAAPKAGQIRPEENWMAAAASAMGRAVASLDALETGPALPPETEALNDLLKAQAEIKRTQVARQQTGAGGPGNNNRNYDVSTLFDRELQEAQQTNYETPAGADRKDPGHDALDRLRDLARRQDELVKRQRDLADARRSLGDDAFKRQLDRLTREQVALRQQAEEMAHAQRGGAADRLRAASEEMRAAADGLRRRDPEEAGTRGNRALDKLRDVERQVQRTGGGDERRRVLGDMQLELRRLADAQRQVAAELARPGNSLAQGQAAPVGQDALRRLAGEEERLAGRAGRLQQELKQAAGGAQAARDLEDRRVVGRMQKSADDLRAAAGQSGSSGQADRLGRSPGSTDDRSGRAQRAQAGAQARVPSTVQEETARAFDEVADRLAAAMGGGSSNGSTARPDAGKSPAGAQGAGRQGAAQSGARSGPPTPGHGGTNADVESGRARQIADQLAKLDALRNRIDRTTRELERLGTVARGRGEPGEAGRAGQGRSGQDAGGQPGADLMRLRDQYVRQLQEAADFLEKLRRDDDSLGPSQGHGGGIGFTFEGQGMTLSAPGTEAFKQDFARWEALARQATTALDRAGSSLSKTLQAQQAKDRLSSGVEDEVPPAYQKQTESYFKALAAKKRP